MLVRHEVLVSEERHPTRGDMLIIASLFIVSRLIFANLLGVRFNVAPLGYWQVIDTYLLKYDLLRSIFYLHSQPPLFNLIVGMFVKMPLNTGTLLLEYLFHAVGLIMCISMFVVMIKIGVYRRLGLVMTLLFMFNPSTVLFENYAFYSYLVMAMLCVSTLSLYKYLETKGMLWLAAFLSLAGSICLIRSSFHIAWFALVVAMLLLFSRDKVLRSKMIPVSSIVFLLVFAWYAKNWYVFGSFSSSSWLGMSLAKTYYVFLSDKELADLAARGTVSHVSTVPSFSPLSEYSDTMASPRSMGMEITDAEYKRDGSVNYNNVNYVDISRRYQSDVLQAVARDPRLLALSILKAGVTYLRPASQYFTDEHFDEMHNMAQVERLDDIYRHFYYLQYDSIRSIRAHAASAGNSPYRHSISDALGLISWTLLLFTAAILFYVPARIRRLMKMGENICSVTLAFAYVNIVYVALITSLLEAGENDRFRFETEALFTILVAIILTDLLKWATSRFILMRARAAGSGTNIGVRQES